MRGLPLGDGLYGLKEGRLARWCAGFYVANDRSRPR